MMQDLAALAGLGGRLQEFIHANAWGHVAAAAQECPDGEQLFWKAVGPEIERCKNVMERLLTLFTTIAEDRSKFAEEVKKFAALRKPKVVKKARAKR